MLQSVLQVRQEISPPLYELAVASVQCTMSTYTSRYNIYFFLQLVCLIYYLFCSCSLIIFMYQSLKMLLITRCYLYIFYIKE